MTVDLKETAELLCGMDDILLLTHRNPDGDAAGSVWALYRALVQMGKRVAFRFSGKLPSDILFASEAEPRRDFTERYVVALDLAVTDLLGDEFAQYADKIDLNIDHHPSNSLFAKKTLLRPQAAATAEIIFDLFGQLCLPIDKRTAEQIYIGIATDTGCFRFSNTSSAVLRCAASLIEAGIDNGEINRLVFETKSRAYLQFETKALQSLRTFFDGRCAVIVLTREMFLSSGLDDSDVHMIASLPRQIEGVVVGVTVKEKDGGFCRVSIRSNPPVDAGKIAAAFGGGGHHAAAGCDVNGTPEQAVEALLREIEKNLRESANGAEKEI